MTVTLHLREREYYVYVEETKPEIWGSEVQLEVEPKLLERFRQAEKLYFEVQDEIQLRHEQQRLLQKQLQQQEKGGEK